LQRPNGTEMPLIKADDVVCLVPVRQDDDCAIGEPELEVGVTRVEVPDRSVVLALQALGCESPGGEVREKGTSWSVPDPTSKQVVDLGGYRRWNDQGTIDRPEQAVDGGKVGVLSIAKRNERPRVDDDRHSPNPSSSSSSGT